jgi:hypothetical protein
MALVKHNNNSISAVTSMASLTTGSMTLISEQTASSSASVEFTTGIDSTYPIYKFEFINIHGTSGNDGSNLVFNLSTDGGSNYNVTKTSTAFVAWHKEDDTGTSFAYNTGNDLAQSTADQRLIFGGLDTSNSDGNGCAELYLYNPSSTTFVKHFMGKAVLNSYHPYAWNTYISGYGNTTSAINAIKFQIDSGNIDSGTIKLYGIKDS